MLLFVKILHKKRISYIYECFSFYQ